MTKKYMVNATITTEMYTVVETPDDWTEEDVMEYYHANGASGEFVEDPFGNSWTWGDVQPASDTELPYVNLTDEDRVN